MMKNSPPVLSIICILVLLSIQCTRKKTEIAWDVSLPSLGSQSSPQAADLNGDGILDIVIGAGQNENQASDDGILAFDGQSGELLWRQQSPDQVFGSATFYDVTGDGTPDVFIGGRTRHFKALDGTNGEVLWEYRYQYENDSILKHARFNFYTAALTPDQNQDGTPDLLVQNGGNVKIAPYVEEGRFPGVLMLLDSKTGAIMAADTMPDGKESYMSPLCFTQPDGELYILFGSGGETIDGRLYLGKMSDLRQRRLANAQVIAAETGHGFIAPPVLADINGDDYLDIVAISHASTVFAIDGKDRRVLWRKQIDGTESSNSFAVGYVNDDRTPDFFTFVSRGEWPNNTGALQIVFDGRNGEIIYQNALGCTGFSSPVLCDLNGDGRDEGILSINEYDCSRRFDEQSPKDIRTRLLTIDFSKREIYTVDQLEGFKNIFTTPWVGDLDNDGYLDIVHCQYYSPSVYLLSFLGMRIKRISTHLRARKAPSWGAYMGPGGNGIYGNE